MVFLFDIVVIMKLMYSCVKKIVDEFKEIELFSDWVSTEEENFNETNISGLGTNDELNDESDTVDDEDGDEISIITESVILGQMNLQEEYYGNNEKEELKVDTLKTIQSYLKKIFRQAKFLSDTGKQFKEPNFVHTNGVRTQSVEICEYLWKSLGKYHLILDVIEFLSYCCNT